MTSIAIDLGQNSLSNNFGIMFFLMEDICYASISKKKKEG